VVFLSSVLALSPPRAVDPEGALRRAAASHREALRTVEIESRAGDSRRILES
jgi:hypothetical protein